MASISNIKSDIKEIVNLKDIADILAAVSSVSYKNLGKIKESKDVFFNSLHCLYIEFMHKAFANAVTPQLKTAALFGSDIVFCGNFNRLTKEQYRNLKLQFSYSKLVLVGKQIRFLDSNAEFFGFPITRRFEEEVYNKKNEVFIHKLLDAVVGDGIDLFYNALECKEVRGENHNKGLIVLPKKISLLRKNFVNANLSSFKQGFESIIAGSIADPSPELLFDKFIDYYNYHTINQVLVESELAENYLRMTTMNTAKDEAEKQIKLLNKMLNRMRQAKITKEITEIINSFKSLKKKKTFY